MSPSRSTMSRSIPKGLDSTVNRTSHLTRPKGLAAAAGKDMFFFQNNIYWDIGSITYAYDSYDIIAIQEIDCAGMPACCANNTPTHVPWKLCKWMAWPRWMTTPLQTGGFSTSMERKLSSYVDLWFHALSRLSWFTSAKSNESVHQKKE